MLAKELYIQQFSKSWLNAMFPISYTLCLTFVSDTEYISHTINWLSSTFTINWLSSISIINWLSSILLSTAYQVFPLSTGYQVFWYYQLVIKYFTESWSDRTHSHWRNSTPSHESIEHLINSFLIIITAFISITLVFLRFRCMAIWEETKTSFCNTNLWHLSMLLSTFPNTHCRCMYQHL